MPNKKSAASTEEIKEKPKGPKRPTSAYFFYSSARRGVMKQTAPNLSMTEVAKLIGAEWKELTDQDKSVYTEMATKDKERYEKQKKELEDTGSWTEESGSPAQHNQAVKRKSDMSKQVPNKRVSKKLQ